MCCPLLCCAPCCRHYPEPNNLPTTGVAKIIQCWVMFILEPIIITCISPALFPLAVICGQPVAKTRSHITEHTVSIAHQPPSARQPSHLNTLSPKYTNRIDSGQIARTGIAQMVRYVVTLAPRIPTSTVAPAALTHSSGQATTLKCRTAQELLLKHKISAMGLRYLPGQACIRAQCVLKTSQLAAGAACMTRNLG